ncbi:MAG TPA: 50S ribosomal protein L33 [Virgibacillus sp.]|nr:50S ribosomal protein L33 [Virgibacillus sp.]
MRKKINLSCTVCANRNYTTYKSSSQNERLEVQKFCKRCGKHTVHKETK